MSLSQKFSGFSLVPWYDSAEWKRVHQLIFGENPSLEKQRQALEILNLWKMRMSLLPSGVEGTIYILEALLMDSDTMNEHQLCVYYCSNIMRFLNICVANRSQVYQFTKTAKSYSIPDWIINIRHDFAHSPKVPSLQVLKLALEECFRWLKDTYWGPESLVIKDYVIEKDATGDGTPIVKLVADLIVWLNSNKPLPHDLFEQLKDFGCENVDCDNFPEVMNELFKNLSDECENNEKWKDLIEDLIFSGCFYLHPKTISDTKTAYTFKYTSKIIEQLHINENLVNLISELQHLMNDSNELESNRNSVSRWLNEIFIGILKSRKPNSKINFDELNGKGIPFKTMPEAIYDEVISLRFKIFEKVNDVNRKCFNSFMLLCTSTNLKDCNEFFNQLKNSGGKTGWQNLENCDDLIDLSKSQDLCSYSSTNETFVIDNKESVSPKPEKERRKRWTLITDMNLEKYALGVNPYMNQTPMETC